MINPIMEARDGLKLPKLMSSRLAFQSVFFRSLIRAGSNGREAGISLHYYGELRNAERRRRRPCRQGVAMQLPLPGSEPLKASGGGGGHLRVILGEEGEKEREIKTGRNVRDGDSGCSPGSLQIS